MKKIFISLVAAVTIYSCNTTPTSYTITGKVAKPELEGKQVRLQRMTDDGWKVFDSTIVQNSTYTFNGSVAQPEAVYIGILSEKEWLMHAQLILENAKITVTSDSLGDRISGTPYNDLLQKYLDEESVPKAKRNKAYNATADLRKAGTLTPALNDSLNAEYSKYYDEMRTITLAFSKANINNVAGQSQLGKLSVLPLEQLKDLISGADTTALKVPVVQEIVDRITGLEKTAIGQPFVDLRMLDPDGKEVALSDYAGKGKYVFIDFWASWCGPCRQEMPHVVAAYKKYKSKGFEIVGVSFDYKKEAWLKGIKDLGLTWPQMSDIKGWDSEGSKLYAVSGIPHTVLLDKNGIIIAKNLRGEELEKKLGELMK